jgi:hypothetical protein
MEVVQLDKKKLVEMRDKYQKELETIRLQLQQAMNTVNQLQMLLIDRQSKIEVLDELLKEEEKSLNESK